MTTAQAKALGLAPASTASDGTVTFASNQPFDFDRSDGITAGQYDFYGSVAHEFSEVMGRELNAIGNTAQFGPANGYFPLDLFKYAAAAGGAGGRTGEGTVERTFEGTVAGYFSPDGGATKGYEFNTHPDGDFGDWGQSVKADSFLAFSFTGLINAVSAMDIEVMDVLGWNAAGVSSAGPAGPGSDGGGDVRSGFARHETPTRTGRAPCPSRSTRTMRRPATPRRPGFGVTTESTGTFDAMREPTAGRTRRSKIPSSLTLGTAVQRDPVGLSQV
jgi:hypothetical protein